MSKAHLYAIHALSPIHCGTGQAISGIDLPIAREKPTNIPLIPGSSLKGVLRASPNGRDKERNETDVHLAAFGPDTANAADYAGSVQFSDANLVFLPMRSVRGTFAYVTSPYMLRRLARDLAEVDSKISVPLEEPKEDGCFVTSERLIVMIDSKTKRVVFEDLDFAPIASTPLLNLATQLGAFVFSTADMQHFQERVCVVHDNVMSILLRTGMEVTARNRIDPDTRTVEGGALWTEEALPVESVLFGIMAVNPVKRQDTDKKELKSDHDVIKHVRDLGGSLQIGGKATVGRGVCRLVVG